MNNPNTAVTYTMRRVAALAFIASIACTAAVTNGNTPRWGAALAAVTLLMLAAGAALAARPGRW
jgi:hypothetical protein